MRQDILTQIKAMLVADGGRLQINSESAFDLSIKRNFTTTLNLILLLNSDKDLQVESSLFKRPTLKLLAQSLKDYSKAESVHLKRMGRRIKDSILRIDNAY